MALSEVKFIDPGLIPYGQAWERQKELFYVVAANRENKESKQAGYLIFCEHPHVITLGLHGKESNLIIPQELLDKKGVELYRTDRGGDITYHGPGQIVAYPILDLFHLKTGVKEYVNKLEEAVILTLMDIGISSTRLHGASGVWLDPDIPGKSRKICAAGVKVSRGISMHGIAFNVNTVLSYFNLINPCGFTDKGVTSVERETGQVADMQKIKDSLRSKIADVFQVMIT